MLKHLPSDALKTIEKNILHSKKPLYFAQQRYDRQNYNSKDLTFTGLNASYTLAKK